MTPIDSVEMGFNSDLSVEGVNFHVQTEDWGATNPFIVTRIFRAGAVLKSVKTPYRDAWKKSNHSAKPERHAIRLAMQIQHQEILDQLASSKKGERALD